MDVVYRIAGALFVVRVGAEDGWPKRFSALCYRVAEDGFLALVEGPDGQALQAQAQSAWQATHRIVTALETYVGSRAEELRNAAVHTSGVQGAWRLSG